MFLGPRRLVPFAVGGGVVVALLISMVLLLCAPVVVVGASSTTTTARAVFYADFCFVDDISGTVGMLVRLKPKVKGDDIALFSRPIATRVTSTATSPWHRTLTAEATTTPLHVESTSGWVILWRDAARSVPFLPTAAEYRAAVTEGAVGYLKGEANCGTYYVQEEEEEG
eukprot:PhM_4_TR941/c0_g1_i1/m.39606